METGVPLFATCVHPERTQNGRPVIKTHIVTFEFQRKVLSFVITLIMENILHECQHISASFETDSFGKLLSCKTIRQNK